MAIMAAAHGNAAVGRDGRAQHRPSVRLHATAWHGQQAVAGCGPLLRRQVLEARNAWPARCISALTGQRELGHRAYTDGWYIDVEPLTRARSMHACMHSLLGTYMDDVRMHACRHARPPIIIISASLPHLQRRHAHAADGVP